MQDENIDVTSITLAAYRMRNKVIADMIRAGWQGARQVVRNIAANAIIVRVGRHHHTA